MTTTKMNVHHAPRDSARLEMGSGSKRGGRSLRGSALVVVKTAVFVALWPLVQPSASGEQGQLPLVAAVAVVRQRGNDLTLPDAAAGDGDFQDPDPEKGADPSCSGSMLTGRGSTEECDQEQAAVGRVRSRPKGLPDVWKLNEVQSLLLDGIGMQAFPPLPPLARATRGLHASLRDAASPRICRILSEDDWGGATVTEVVSLLRGGRADLVGAWLNIPDRLRKTTAVIEAAMGHAPQLVQHLTWGSDEFRDPVDKNTQWSTSVVATALRNRRKLPNVETGSWTDLPEGLRREVKTSCEVIQRAVDGAEAGGEALFAEWGWTKWGLLPDFFRKQCDNIVLLIVLRNVPSLLEKLSDGDGSKALFKKEAIYRVSKELHVRDEENMIFHWDDRGCRGGGGLTKEREARDAARAAPTKIAAAGPRVNRGVALWPRAEEDHLCLLDVFILKTRPDLVEKWTDFHPIARTRFKFIRAAIDYKPALLEDLFRKRKRLTVDIDRLSRQLLIESPGTRCPGAGWKADNLSPRSSQFSALQYVHDCHDKEGEHSIFASHLPEDNVLLEHDFVKRHFFRFPPMMTVKDHAAWARLPDALRADPEVLQVQLARRSGRTGSWAIIRNWADDVPPAARTNRAVLDRVCELRPDLLLTPNSKNSDECGAGRRPRQGRHGEN